MFGLHFILMVVLYFLKPARDSLFLTEIGPDELPYVYILLAAVAIPVSNIISRLTTRYPIRSVLMWTLGVLTANILALRWMFELDINWIFLGFYIWVGIFGILVISLFWLLANSVFNPAQSKRIFSFLTLGAILGAIMGSQVSSLIVSMLDISTENLLFICAIILVLCMIVLTFISTGTEEVEKSNAHSRENRQTSTLKSALKVIKSRYYLTITVIIGLTMVTTTFTDYQFKVLALDSFPEKASLTSFMGIFYAGVSLASLGIQVLFSTQIIKRLGLTGAILSRPVGMMVGAVLMIIEPVLASVVILNGIDGATRYSIDKTGRELLFLPLSRQNREEVKIFVDIFADRFSRGLGGVLLLGFTILLDWSVYSLTFIIAAFLVIWVILGIQARKGYIEKFRNSVQKQLIGTGSIALNLDEPTIYSVIRESLHCNQDNQVLHTLYLLEDHNTEKVADDLRQLLSHENREIKLKALQLLQHVGSKDYSDEILQLLTDKDPEVRMEAIYYLCQHSDEDPAQVLKSYLEHRNYKLKSAALECASKHDGVVSDLVEPEFFDDLLDQDDTDAVFIKAQLADSFGYIQDDEIVRKYLVRLIDDDHPSVVRNTIASMGRQQDDRFISLLINKLGDTEFTLEITKALGSFDINHLLLYKYRFFDDKLNIGIRKRLPDIFYYYREQSSVDHLLDMIDIENPDLRYHVIKTLNKLIRKQPELKINETKVRSIIRREAKNYFKLLAIKQLQPLNRPNRILLKALDEKLKQGQERLFRLLGLVYNPNDMYGTYLSLQSISPEKRSAAIEFLDNLLTDSDHEIIFPIVDDRSDAEKLKAARNQFKLPYFRYDEGLLQLINGEDLWLKTCAIYSVSPKCPANLQSKVKEAAQSPNPMIRETAELVMKRNSHKMN